jgi:transcriptional regulator with XRE-family HTH domain
MQLQDHFQDFVSDPKRRRIYEREALAFEASELISGLMEDQKVSKTELAGLTGSSKSHITQLLSGSRNMTMHTLADLAFVLGHKIELKPAPLVEVASWLEIEDQAGRGYFEGWGGLRSSAYRSSDSQDPDQPRSWGLVEECLQAVA